MVSINNDENWQWEFSNNQSNWHLNDILKQEKGLREEKTQDLQIIWGQNIL